MDETKKQELNKAIEVLKDFCNSNACQIVDNNTQKLRVDSGCCNFCNGHKGD